METKMDESTQRRVNSYDELFALACANAGAVANAAKGMQKDVFAIMAAAALEDTKPGKFTSRLILFMHEGYEKIADVMNRRSSGIFSNDEVHHELKEAKALELLADAAAAALNIPAEDISTTLKPFLYEHVWKAKL